MLFSHLHGHQTCTWCTDIHTGKTSITNKIKFKLKKTNKQNKVSRCFQMFWGRWGASSNAQAGTAAILENAHQKHQACPHSISKLAVSSGIFLLHTVTFLNKTFRKIKSSPNGFWLYFQIQHEILCGPWRDGSVVKDMH